MSKEVVRKVYSLEFGDYIRELRISMNWSVRAMAKILNVSHTYVNDLEIGSRPAPSKEKLDILIKVFDIDKSKSDLYHFYNLAAKTRNTIPLDVEEFLLKNPILIEFIRQSKNRDFISVDYVNNLLQTIVIESK